DRSGDVDRVRAGGGGGAGCRGGGGVGHRRGGHARAHRVGDDDRLGGVVGQIERAVDRLAGRGRAGLAGAGLGDRGDGEPVVVGVGAGDPGRVSRAVVLHRQGEGVSGRPGVDPVVVPYTTLFRSDRSGDVDRVRAGGGGGAGCRGGGGVGHRRGGHARAHRVGDGDRLGRVVGQIEQIGRASCRERRRGLGGAGRGDSGDGEPVVGGDGEVDRGS